MQISIDDSKDSKTILYYNLVDTSLNTLKKSSPSKYENILGEDRIKQYELNNFPLELALRFFKNSIEPSKKPSVFSCLKGYEWNIMLTEWLKKMNAYNIQNEVDLETKYGNTSIDAVCNFNKTNKSEYTIILPTLEETKVIMNNKYDHSFEAKSNKKLQDKAILQIKKAKTIYPVNHVYVCSDTRVGEGVAKQIYNIGNNVDIIRSDMSRSDISNRVLNIQKQISLLEQRNHLKTLAN